MTELLLTCAGNNARPARTEEMRREAAIELVSRMVASGTIEKVDQDGSVDDIVKATRYETWDGYKIARELESRYHWDCDMRIAEELEEFGAILDRIYDAAEKKWAAENPRTPEFSDGDAVVWRFKPSVVRGVCEYRPFCYKVRQDGMSGGETSYYVVPFEEVTAP